MIKAKVVKIKNYIYFFIDSLLLGFISIFIHRNFIFEKNVDVNIFTTQRIILFVGLSLCFFVFFLIISVGDKKRKVEQLIIEVATHPLTLAILLIISFRLWYLEYYKSFMVYYDTKTYTVYPYNIFKGETDIFRTPVYPYFLKLIHYISNFEIGSDEFYSSVALIQQIISLISAVILYFAVRKFYKNKYICAAVALVYGANPMVFSWDLCILTESLSLFATVLLIYILFSFIKKPTVALACILSIYSFVMIMLRPTFIYLFAILGVFYIAKFILCKTTRKQCIAGLLALVVAGGMVLGYCGLNKKNYSYFGISSVSSTINNLYMVMYSGITHNENYPKLTETIENAITDPSNQNWITDIIEILPLDYSYSEISDYVNDCIKNNKDKFNVYTVDKFKQVLNLKIPVQYVVEKNSNKPFEKTNEQLMFYLFPFSFAGCLLLVAFGIIWTLIMLILKMRICWQVIGLSALIFTHIFVSIYGSMAEFSRLSVMVVPFVLILVFYLADYLIGVFKSKRIINLTDSDSTEIKIK